MNLNWSLGPQTRGKIRQHWAVFRVLWHNFVLVARRCRANGGSIAFEWPRRCSYWNKRQVRKFMLEFGIKPYHLDGCAFGLVSQAPRSIGKPIRKPWTIASDVPAFSALCRCCTHLPEQHVRCQGSDTRLTEGYTDDLARAIHLAWQVHVDVHDRVTVPTTRGAIPRAPNSKAGRSNLTAVPQPQGNTLPRLHLSSPVSNLRGTVWSGVGQ